LHFSCIPVSVILLGQQLILLAFHKLSHMLNHAVDPKTILVFGPFASEVCLEKTDFERAKPAN